MSRPPSWARPCSARTTTRPSCGHWPRPGHRRTGSSSAGFRADVAAELRATRRVRARLGGARALRPGDRGGDGRGRTHGVPPPAAARRRSPTDGVSALMHPPGDVEALAQALRRLSWQTARCASGWRREAAGGQLDFAPGGGRPDQLGRTYDAVLDGRRYRCPVGIPSASVRAARRHRAGPGGPERPHRLPGQRVARVQAQGGSRLAAGSTPCQAQRQRQAVVVAPVAGVAIHRPCQRDRRPRCVSSAGLAVALDLVGLGQVAQHRRSRRPPWPRPPRSRPPGSRAGSGPAWPRIPRGAPG